MKEQKACYNCRHRVPNASAADKCNIDGRRIAFTKCFTNWCPYWAMDELRNKEVRDEKTEVCNRERNAAL